MAKKNKYADWTKEELLKRVEALEKRKKYGLVWDEERTKEKFEAEAEGKLPVLKEVKSKEIKTDSNQPTHILIEGDNYHALSVLAYTHEKKVDVIYIDPPYNTGNKDFRFNDVFVEKEDAYRHSKWLSFMKKRLKLARNILKQDGVLFCSIDDNEYSQLKMLSDEIFGEHNFIATIIWQRVYSPKNQSKRISVDHEYILAYARNINNVDFNLLPRTEKMNARYKNPDKDARGPWKPGDLVANEERTRGHFIIVGPKGDEFNSPPGKHWAFGEETLREMINDNRIYFGKNGKAFPSLKQFLSEVQQGRKASTIFLHTEAGHNDEAKKELKDFFEQSEELFSTPKPTRLIKQLLRLIQNKNAVMLDFMAGSGTSGQACIDLNSEDGGKRSAILTTNNENNICTRVCYPRISKVIKGYEATNGKTINGLGGNLKYFKTSFVPSEPTDRNKAILTKEAVSMLCLRENTFDVVSETDTLKIFENSDKYTGIIFDQLEIPQFKKEAAKFKKPVCVYVFSLSDDDFSEEFAELKKVKACSIPEAILRVYRRIFK